MTYDEAVARGYDGPSPEWERATRCARGKCSHRAGDPDCGWQGPPDDDELLRTWDATRSVSRAARAGMCTEDYAREVIARDEEAA